MPLIQYVKQVAKVGGTLVAGSVATATYMLNSVGSGKPGDLKDASSMDYTGFLKFFDLAKRSAVTLETGVTVEVPVHVFVKVPVQPEIRMPNLVENTTICLLFLLAFMILLRSRAPRLSMRGRFFESWMVTLLYSVITAVESLRGTNYDFLKPVQRFIDTFFEIMPLGMYDKALIMLVTSGCTYLLEFYRACDMDSIKQSLKDAHTQTLEVEQDKKKLEEEILAVSGEKAKALETISPLEEQQRELIKEKSVLVDGNAKYVKEMATLKGDTAKVTEEKSALQSRLRESIARISGLDEKCETLERELDIKVAKLEVVAEKVALHTAELQKGRDEAEEQRVVYEVGKKETEMKKSLCEGEIINAKAEIVMLMSRIVSLEQSITREKDAKSEIEEKCKALVSMLEQEKAAATEATAAAVEKLSFKFEAELKALKEDYRKAEMQVSEMLRERHNAEHARARLDQEVGALRTKCEELQQKIEGLGQELNLATAHNIESSSQAASIRLTLVEAKEENQTLGQKLSVTNDEKDALSKLLEDEKSRAEGYKIENGKLITEIKELEALIDSESVAPEDLVRELSRTKAESKDRLNQNLSMADRLEVALLDRNNIQDKLDALTTRNTALQGDYNSARSKLRMLEDENSRLKASTTEVDSGKVASFQLELEASRSALKAADLKALHATKNANGSGGKVTKLTKRIEDLEAGRLDNETKELQSEVFRLRKLEASASRQGQDIQKLTDKINSVLLLLIKTVDGKVTTAEAREEASNNGWLTEPAVPATQIKKRVRGRKHKGPKQAESSNGKAGDKGENEDEDEEDVAISTNDNTNSSADPDGDRPEN